MPRYCPDCGAPLIEGRECAECRLRLGLASATTATSAPTIDPGPSLNSLDPARFIPGTVLGGRYRMVGLLGRGGMGEVYRADDLKLGQPVALKFLPEEVERDPKRLERLLSEVKLARQVSHPNVCRVYDVGEVDGHHYLSMEYVDGVDLASLLRQIGRLPQDKALQIARQLCAGLGAAHEQGILHRDLKPANVMIDGRGRARITDFGLAHLEGRQEKGILGTPAYMSPEQMEGHELTARSDIYSLGLVLYELFTGKPPYEASSTTELRQRRLDSSPTDPSGLVEGLDPAVERAILRSLERDPENRPGSALALAAALPGGDPVAAALAAGETPSPEMVAAAGTAGGLPAGVAVALLAYVLAGIVAVAYLHPEMALQGRVTMSRSVPALTENARQILRDLGYTETPVDSSSHLETDTALVDYLAGRDDGPSRWDTLADSRQLVLGLFYRQAPRVLAPFDSGDVFFDSPPRKPGDIVAKVDLEGRLTFLLVEPPRTEHEETHAEAPDWSVLFDKAGLDLEEFESARPAVFRNHADARAAWTGELPAHGGIPVRIEAAAWRGKPVYFEKVLPSSPNWSDPHEDDERGGLSTIWFTPILVVLFLVPVVGVFLAVRNLRLGRGDRRGALRVALFVFGLALSGWILTSHHVASFDEVGLLIRALAFSLLMAAVAWGLYLALEPYVRRLWPRILVSWSRLIAGRFGDPLVGRDLLIGLAFGVTTRLLYYAGYRAPEWFDSPAPFIAWFGLDAMRGARWALGNLVDMLLVNLFIVFATLLTLVLLRTIVRRQWLAVVAYGAFSVLGSAVNLVDAADAPGMWPLAVVLGTVQAVIFLVLIFRFGLVAMMAGGLTEVVKHLPVTADASAPHFGVSLIGPMFLAGVALYGFVVCRRGSL